MTPPIVEKFAEFTQIINSNYRILYFDVKTPHPTPLQWTFFTNELKENIRVLDNLNCRFAFILNVKIIGLLNMDYILDFINILNERSVILENKLISSSIIYEGVLINKMFEIIKLFYQTKKPLEFVGDMRKAVDFIDKNL